MICMTLFFELCLALFSCFFYRMKTKANFEWLSKEPFSSTALLASCSASSIISAIVSRNEEEGRANSWTTFSSTSFFTRLFRITSVFISYKPYKHSHVKLVVWIMIYLKRVRFRMWGFDSLILLACSSLFPWFFICLLLPFLYSFFSNLETSDESAYSIWKWYYICKWSSYLVERRGRVKYLSFSALFFTSPLFSFSSFVFVFFVLWSFFFWISPLCSN